MNSSLLLDSALTENNFKGIKTSGDNYLARMKQAINLRR